MYLSFLTRGRPCSTANNNSPKQEKKSPLTFEHFPSSWSCLPSPAASAAHAATAASTPTTPAAAAPAAVRDLLAGLVLGLDRVIDEEGVERQRVGQDKVADRGAANVHGVERDGVLTPRRHLDGPQRRVHLWRD